MSSLPEHFEEFAEARRNGFLQVKKLKDSGAKIVGTFCQYTPAEIMDAAGLYQVGLCGKSAAPIPAAETRLPSNLCPLIKASYGHALEDSCPYAYFSDMVMGETTCDGKKKMYEMLGEIKPMYVIHLPNVPDKRRSLKPWTMEVRAFKENIEAFFGVEITDEALREAIKWGNKERIQAARIYELGKLDPPAITGMQMRHVLDGEQYMFDKQSRYDHVEEILNRCEEDRLQGRGPYQLDEHPLRILISGAGLGGTEDKTIGVIEELGAAVVCYEGCSGISSRRRLIEESDTKDPIECIAEKYLEVPCAVMSPNDRRMEQVRDTIIEWKIDGVVHVNLHSCHPFGIESQRIAKVCAGMDIPFLRIETDFYPNDAGQIRTRIEAFLELLEDNRITRKESENHE
ncbi:MAG: 2-hydroxyacyl-CoA dehydratase [Lachnospiraceae bacterium]|nr:2-hydroxyacyl-CoA dehydratase [Candidatus Equihabitans merdae]